MQGGCGAAGGAGRAAPLGRTLHLRHEGVGHGVLLGLCAAVLLLPELPHQRWSLWPRRFGERLAEIFLELQGQGAHNINLVNPTHYAPPIAEALRLAKTRGLTLPVVCNSGGYDSSEVLAAFAGLVDIYLPDLKYRSQQASAAYSGAADYFAVASRAIPAMLAQVGLPVFDGDGLLRRGLIVRHLMLPGQAADSLALLDWLAGALPAGSFLLSLMCQYIPSHRAAEHRELNRRLTTLEYQKVLRRADELGLAGFRQERPSASDAYVPDFNLEGV